LRVVVRYSEMIAKLETALRTICQAMDLNHSPRMPSTAS